MENKVLLLVCLGLLVMPLMSAALTINVPIANGNYTTTLGLNVTTALTEAKNVTCWYNISGGDADTTSGNLTGLIANTSASQTEFTKSVDIDAITDGSTFNVSCTAWNDTESESANLAGITFDSADPTVTLYVDLDSMSQSYGRLIEYSCVTTDGIDGSPTETFAVAHPSGDETSSTSLTLQSTYLQFDDTDCAGDYVFTCSSEDYTGNSASDSATVTVDALGNLIVSKKAGSNKSWIWVVLIGVGIYLFMQRK